MHLAALCLILAYLQHIEVIFLDPVHNIIHSIRAHHQTTLAQVLQILLVNYIIAT